MLTKLMASFRAYFKSETATQINLKLALKPNPHTQAKAAVKGPKFERMIDHIQGGLCCADIIADIALVFSYAQHKFTLMPIIVLIAINAVLVMILVTDTESDSYELTTDPQRQLYKNSRAWSFIFLPFLVSLCFIHPADRLGQVAIGLNIGGLAFGLIYSTITWFNSRPDRTVLTNDAAWTTNPQLQPDEPDIRPALKKIARVYPNRVYAQLTNLTDIYLRLLQLDQALPTTNGSAKPLQALVDDAYESDYVDRKLGAWRHLNCPGLSCAAVKAAYLTPDQTALKQLNLVDEDLFQPLNLNLKLLLHLGALLNVLVNPTMTSDATTYFAYVDNSLNDSALINTIADLNVAMADAEAATTFWHDENHIFQITKSQLITAISNTTNNITHFAANYRGVIDAQKHQQARQHTQALEQHLLNAFNFKPDQVANPAAATKSPQTPAAEDKEQIEPAIQKLIDEVTSGQAEVTHYTTVKDFFKSLGL